jgi:hypothetical protein
MNTFARLVVNEHLASLLDEAATRRPIRSTKPSLTGRIRSAASRVQMAVTTPVDRPDSILPALVGYPYRG